jgi:acyl-CoA thioesterase
MKKEKLSIVNQMYENDAFSQWLGIERIEEYPGFSKIKMQVRKEMTNGFDVAHGGITFSLADSAFAFASNSRGKHAVSIDCSINHLKPVHTNDILTAVASEESCSNKLATYIVRVTNQNEELVALFKGMVYRTRKEWEEKK